MRYHQYKDFQRLGPWTPRGVYLVFFDISERIRRTMDGSVFALLIDLGFFI